MMKLSLADIHRFHHILDQTGLLEVTWLVGGLVLGYARNGQPIAHDTDVDMGIMAQDIRKFWEAVPVFERNNFAKLFRWVNNDGLITEYSFRFHRVKWEFFIHFDAGRSDVEWYAYHQKEAVELKRRMAKPKLGWITFLGMKWKAPKDVEGYLAAQYGEDWREPNPAWNYRTDCPANVSRKPYKRTNPADIKWPKDHPGPGDRPRMFL